ncbi:UNVERIFIED_CONTAM: hypothetical protein Scaly_1191700 [Sesamum calycinum]|uniref:Uncharacterized protein n=1 Tax=Sesamum calycinum TaxID=2727403 RepID=A0AAW2Q4B9_9LAMI
MGVVAELVDIKADGHISERIYDRISNRLIEYYPPPDRTLPGDYYNTKKLVKDLDLPIEKIDACKNNCILYWKDDVDLEYCKPSRGQDPGRKKSPYAILRGQQFTGPGLAMGCTSTTTATTSPQAQRHYINFQDARSGRDFLTIINNEVKGHYPHPWADISQIPQEHQLFWFQNLKSMFKVVKSQAEKFLRKRFVDDRNQLVRQMWLAEETCRQLLEFWVSLEFQLQSVKNKVNWAANPKAAVTVYHGGSSSVGTDKCKLETQLGCLVNQMEVFEKVYKKKDDGDVLEAVGGTLETREQQQRTCTLVSSLRVPKRVFDLGSKAHHMIAGP